MTRYRRNCLRLAILSFVTAILIFVLGVLPGFANGFDQAQDVAKPVGIVVWNVGTFPQDVNVLPEIDMYYSYRGHYGIGVDAEMVSYYMTGTFIKYNLHCADTVMVFHSPNSSRVGHAITEFDSNTGRHENSPREAVKMFLQVEAACQKSRLIALQASPHNYSGEAPGSYDGTGAEYIDEFLDIYERETGNIFPYYVGVVLSENGDLSEWWGNEYAIEQQMDDYLGVARKHSVRLWTSYLGCKECSYDRWISILELAHDNTNAVFIANNQDPWPDVCYRSLICNGELTIAGQALEDFINNK